MRFGFKCGKQIRFCCETLAFEFAFYDRPDHLDWRQVGVMQWPIEDGESLVNHVRGGTVDWGVILLPDESFWSKVMNQLPEHHVISDHFHI
jgi:hypothetical protein